jgi:hypothetical protein
VAIVGSDPRVRPVQPEEIEGRIFAAAVSITRVPQIHPTTVFILLSLRTPEQEAEEAMRRMNLGQEQNTEPQSDYDTIESRGTRGE